jgi:DNA-binding MarR family transcriptional regulator|tara:strand:+ start:245 stop:559 length:315 start_codon:yes stop_codon:yes gene_type:complete
MSSTPNPLMTEPHINAMFYLYQESRVRSKKILLQSFGCPKSYNKEYLKELSIWGYINKLPLLEDMREVQYQLSALGEQFILEMIKNGNLQRTHNAKLETHLHAS